MKKYISALFIIVFCSCQSDKGTTVNSTIETSAVPVIETPAVEQEKKAVTNCDANVRAYEFGREMATMVKLGASSLQSAISEFAEPLGIEEPFKSSNPCVIKGFEDENKGIPSPYNKEGKNWTSF